MIGYLKSYDPRMTTAVAHCVSGCQCSPVALHGYEPKDHTSITVFAYVHIPQPTGGQACVLQVKADKNERKEVAKFKINSIIVLESGTNKPHLSGGLIRMPV
jgi:hypothetical protein